MFCREVSIYMWGKFAFDKHSYKNVSKAERNAMEEHFRRRFNFEEVEIDCERVKLKGGITAVYMKRYRDRKAEAKEEFVEMGGYGNLEGVRATPPDGMGVANWNKTIDFFYTKKYMDRCEVNKLNRKKQKFTNRGGTASHSSWSYKNNKSALETYFDAHTLPDGTFASEEEQRNYDLLKEEFDSQRTEASPYMECEGVLEESSASRKNVVPIFEKVLGVRRGHTRGIGRKPSTSSAMSVVGPSENEQTRPIITEGLLDELFEDDRFMERLFQAMDKKKALKKRKKNATHEGEDESEDEEEE